MPGAEMPAMVDITVLLAWSEAAVILLISSGIPLPVPNDASAAEAPNAGESRGSTERTNPSAVGVPVALMIPDTATTVG